MRTFILIILVILTTVAAIAPTATYVNDFTFSYAFSKQIYGVTVKAPYRGFVESDSISFSSYGLVIENGSRINTVIRFYYPVDSIVMEFGDTDSSIIEISSVDSSLFGASLYGVINEKMCDTLLHESKLSTNIKVPIDLNKYQTIMIDILTPRRSTTTIQCKYIIFSDLTQAPEEP